MLFIKFIILEYAIDEQNEKFNVIHLHHIYYLYHITNLSSDIITIIILSYIKPY